MAQFSNGKFEGRWHAVERDQGIEIDQRFEQCFLFFLITELIPGLLPEGNSDGFNKRAQKFTERFFVLIDECLMSLLVGDQIKNGVGHEGSPRVKSLLFGVSADILLFDLCGILVHVLSHLLNPRIVDTLLALGNLIDAISEHRCEMALSFRCAKRLSQHFLLLVIS